MSLPTRHSRAFSDRLFGRSQRVALRRRRLLRRPVGEPDRGSASLWVLTGGLLVLLLAFGAALRGTAVLARHRAEAAADLAALAAAQGIGVDPTVADMCRRAAAVATANGARVTRCVVNLGANERTGTAQVSTTVSVDFPAVGRHLALARAQAERLPP